MYEMQYPHSTIKRIEKQQKNFTLVCYYDKMQK